MCVCVSACVPACCCAETPGGSAASCGTERQLVEGQEDQEKQSAQEHCPSSREQTGQSVLNPSGAFVPRPGKCGGEGRQRWRGGHKRTPPDLEGEKKKTHSGKYKTNQKTPATYPGFSPEFPSKRILKSNSLCEINAEISVTGRLTAMLADDRTSEMVTPLVRCLPEITWNL